MTDMTGLDLTRKLIAFNTINPPGNEFDCATFLADILERAGFEIKLHDWQSQRPNLIATLPATESPARDAIVYSGHLDTVPLGQARWTVDPFAGEVKNGRLYGRGTSDMKSGVAACVMAGLALAREPVRRAEVRLILSAGEETGCEGVLALAERPDILGTCEALIVAEPTDNRPFVGHKGALWLQLVHRGVTAHGSMPDKGVNAIFAACKSVEALRGFDFGVTPHPVMGGPSLNIGNMMAGMNINSVPDLALVGVDIRSTVGQSNAADQGTACRASGRRHRDRAGQRYGACLYRPRHTVDTAGVFRGRRRLGHRAGGRNRELFHRRLGAETRHGQSGDADHGAGRDGDGASDGRIL